MDENPLTEIEVQERGGLTSLWTQLALNHVLHGNVEQAERTLRAIPRNERGRVVVALDDLSMLLSRL